MGITELIGIWFLDWQESGLSPLRASALFWPVDPLPVAVKVSGVVPRLFPVLLKAPLLVGGIAGNVEAAILNRHRANPRQREKSPF
jgi:hypothetical protein